MAGDGVITVSPEEVEGRSDTITVSPEELNAPAQASPDAGNQELAKYGLSANPNPSSHPDLEPVSRIPTPANIPSGAPIAPGSYDEGSIGPLTAADQEPLLKPEEHPILNAIARTGAALEKGATLGTLDPATGSVGVPFGTRHQVAPPIAAPAPYPIDVKFVPPPVGPLPNSPETPAIPVSASVPGAAEGTAEMIGSAPAFGAISRGTDAALGGILDRLGMRATGEALQAPTQAIVKAGAQPASNVEDAVNKMLQLETARRIAAQAIAGGVVGGAQPTGPGESHLENAAAGVGVGAAAGGANEMLGAVANAVRDANLQGHFKTILDAEKAVSDFLLAKKEITDPNGNKITINSREEADRLAQELLQHAGRVSDAKDIKEFAKQAKEFGKQAQSATKEVTRQAEAKARAEQAPGRGGPRKPPPAEAAGTAPKPAEPNPPAPTSDGAAVPQHETVTVQPHELEGGLEGAPDQQIRPQGGVKPEAESIEAETGRIVKGAKVTVNVDGQPTQGVVQWIGAGEKSNVARVKVEGNRTVSRPIDQLKIVPKGELTAGPEEITVPKQELEQESAIEQARRGAGEPPAEELPVNRVPIEQRPSTTIPQEENANMAARLDKRNLRPGEQNAVGKGINETGDSSERQRVSPQREKAEASGGNSLGQRETSPVAGEQPTGKTEEVEPKYEFGSTQINVPKESPLYKEHQKAAAQIATGDLAPNGREENPHVTVRYGLKDTSPEQAAKITAAVKDTKPFWVSLGETKSFPAGKDGVPLFSEVQKTPELDTLRKTVEGAGDFKADDHGEYKPHVTLGYVKPGTEDKYVGKKGLKGQTVLVDHIAITKQDGSQEVVKLQGAKIPENSVRKGGRGESPEPLSGHGATSQNQPSNEVGKQEVGRAPGNEFKDGDRVTWTGSKGEKLTGTVRGTSSNGTASVDTDQVRTIGGRIPIGRVEHPSVTALERITEPSERLGTQLPSPNGSGPAQPAETQPRPLIKEEATASELKLSPPPADIGVRQFIDSLPENQRTYAKAQWAAMQDKGPAAFSRANMIAYGPLMDITGILPSKYGLDEDDVEHLDDHFVKLLQRPAKEPATKPEREESTVPEQTNGTRPTSTEGGRPVRATEGPVGISPSGIPARTDKESGEEGPVRRAPEQSNGTGNQEPAREPEGGTESGSGARDRLSSDLPGTGKTKPVKNADWYSHPEDFSVDAANRQRLEWNINAIKLMRAALDGQALTDTDRAALAHYVGWGALQWAFDPSKAPYNEQRKWSEAYSQLKTLLSEDEFAAARKSTMNAHYTSPEVVRFVWNVAKKLGFDGGTVLEPSMGSGNFFGMMPKGIRSKSSAIGNELDPTTYNIAKLLYPSAAIFNKDFVQLLMPNDSVDLAISNVPFGEKVYDPKRPKLHARVHDYFFVKSLDLVRPGGIVAYITATGTLDKKNSSIRETMADKADLLFAVRFPENTFDKNAGTKVITDLVVLKRRAPGEVPKGESFTNLREVEVEYGPAYAGRYGGKTTKLMNEYFVEHPQNVLGKLAIGRGQHEPEELIVLSSGDLSERLKEALERVPKNVYSKPRATPVLTADTETVFAPDHLEEGNYTVVDGKVMQRQNGVLKPAESVLNKRTGEPSSDLVDRAAKLIELRDSLRNLLGTMREQPDDEQGNKNVRRLQGELITQYGNYVKKHGFLGAPKAKSVFQEDPHYPLLLSLEDWDEGNKTGKPADIFTKRTVFPPRRVTALSDDPQEALYQTLSERGRPDTEFMAQLTGKDKAEIEKQLTAKELIFKDPISGLWQTREKYLSGYIREKLADAKAALDQGSKEYQRNVEALEKVVPADIPIQDIDVKLGATWIPVPTIQEFARKTFGFSHNPNIDSLAGTWAVDNFPRTAEVTAEYGGGDWTADKLLEASLNQKSAITYDVSRDEHGREIRTVNPDKTAAARAAQQKIKNAFSKWTREHEDWGPKLARIYNDTYNGIVTPEYDGSHLTFPGMNRQFTAEGETPLRAHQVSAIWRILQEGRALLAHVVGAGKTYEMIGSAMEMKRLGMIRKPMFAVKNGLSGQFAADFLKLYPGARVLVPSKNDFESIKRNRMMSKIATNDWDAVIVEHSQFDLMDISPELMRRSMQRDLDELQMTYEAVAARDGKNARTTKQLEKAKSRLEAKLAELGDLKADKTITFDQSGVDHLYVDEADLYKNLAFYTKMNRVAGLSQGNAKRATRLKAKTDYLLEKYNNRGVVFATGTPISNTMAEMYHMIRYLAPDVLEKAGIKFFDDWAANFGTVVNAMELSADSRTYRSRDKFAKFSNVPELLLMFRSFADVKMRDDLNLPTPPRETKNGKALQVMVPTNEVIEPLIQECIERAKACRGEGNRPKPDPRDDNMLKVTDDGRKLATDARLFDPSLEDHEMSKLNAVVDKAFEEWKEGQEENTTGIIFLDRFQVVRMNGVKYDEAGEPIPGTGVPEVVLNLYQDMKKKLVAQGVPEKEIAIIHEFEKQSQRKQLYADMNAGRVRVLMGSTEKMGAGMNVQKKLKWMIHADLPWKPRDLEQREGRIDRQGNDNKSIRVWYALTEKSFDTYMLQTLQTKAGFIAQILSGKFKGRSMVDPAAEMALSLSEMMAAASGNPDVRKKIELEQTVQNLQALKRAHDAAIIERKINANQARRNAADYRTQAEIEEKVFQTWQKATEGDKFHAKILGHEFDDREKFSAFLKEQSFPVANLHMEWNGLRIRLEPVIRETKPHLNYYIDPARNGHVINDLSSLVHSVPPVIRNLGYSVDSYRSRADAQEKKADKLDELAKETGFEQQGELVKTERELREVNKRLGIKEDDVINDQQVAAEADNTEDAPASDEDGEEPNDVAFNLPYEWDGVTPLPQDAPAGSYEPPDGIFPPILTVNRSMRNIMASGMKARSNFEGVSITKEMALRGAEWLEKNSGGFPGNVMNPDRVNENMKRAAHLLAKAAYAAGDSGVVIALDSAVPGVPYLNVLREELFHSIQKHIGAGLSMRHMGNYKDLLEHPAAKKYIKHLQSTGYVEIPDFMYVTEMAAKIGAMNDDLMFTVITPEEAADWFTEYLDHVAEANGISAIDLFNNPNVLHKAVLEMFSVMRAWVASNQEKKRNAAAERQPNQPASAERSGTGDTRAGPHLRQNGEATSKESPGGGDKKASPETAYSLEASGGGGAAPKPAKERFRFEDENVEDEIGRARGLAKPGALDRFKQTMTRLGHMATRKYEDLPRNATFEPLRFSLTQLEHARGVTADRAIRDMHDILNKLDENQYYNFNMKVLLDDLAESVADGLEVPFYQDHELLKRDHEALTGFIANDPAIRESLEKRDAFWREIKEQYTTSMDEIGFKAGKRFQRDSYFRHQVLMHANERERTKGSGAKLRTPTGRGFLKTREGSNLPINTDYVQAEYEVMAQMRFDTEVARTIGLVKDKYNVAESLKRQAVAENESNIMEFFAELIDKEGLDTTPQKMFRSILNTKQARGYNRLQQLASEGNLPVGSGGQWNWLVEELADNYRANLALKQMLEENWKPTDRISLTDRAQRAMFAYANYLMKTKSDLEGMKAAGLIFKGMAEKKAYIKEKLGEEYVTWKNLVPEGYTIWQPREGSLLYFTKTLPEHVIDELTKGAAGEVGITADQLRSVLAKGQRFQEYVVPQEVADTLDNLRKDQNADILSRIHAGLVKPWKWWELNSPRRALKFRMRHISGQAEAMFIGNPSGFSKILKAAHHLHDYFHHGLIKPELKPWIERGGTGSLLRVVEMTDLSKLKQFEQLYQQNKAKKISVDLLKGYVNAANLSIDFAESLLRYSAFLDYRGQMAEGRKPENFGASTPEEVMALEDRDDRAFKLSNDLLGSYDDISALGREVRKILPFWSFREINAKRYYRFFANAVRAGGYGSGGGGGNNNGGNRRFGFADDSDGWNKWQAFSKVAGVAGRTAPVLALKVGQLMLKMAALWATVTAYNYLFHRDEEAELPPEVQGAPHIIFGRNKQGEVLYTPKLGLLADLLDWVGLSAPQRTVREWLDGHRTASETAKEMLKGFPNSVINSLSPLMKLPVEMLSGISLFPDATKPRTIRDRWEYFFNELALKPEYQAASGKPTRGYLHTLPDVLLNRVDGQQSAYYDIQDLKHQWLQQRGRGEEGASSFTPKSEALHNMRLAMHFGDKKAWERYANEYFTYGGTPDGIEKSMRGLDPLFGLKDEEKLAFFAGLSSAEQQELGQAELYYYTYLSPGTLEEEPEDTPGPATAAR